MSNEHMNFMVKLGGKDYLQVAGRILWFRNENPLGSINTDLFSIDDKRIIVKAVIVNGDGIILGTGYGTAPQVGKQAWVGREVEKAETAAIGRALAIAGYGTQFAGDDLEEDDNLADSPIDSDQKKHTPRPAPPVPQLQGAEEQWISIASVETKTDKNGKPYIKTVAGNFFSRAPFEALGIDVSGWDKLGQHALPSAVKVYFTIDKAGYKVPTQYVELDGIPL
jgi:hypothetical protein